jgi:hypothetical protein
VGGWKHVGVLKPPKPDPRLDPFRDGIAVLRRDGKVAGHVAATIMTFWAPFSLSLRRKWWVWFIVVWANGDRERPEEDYPPWTVVTEILSGTFSWDLDDVHRGQYEVEWLSEIEREAVRADLRIAYDDF